jgi:hypothetical protein
MRVRLSITCFLLLLGAAAVLPAFGQDISTFTLQSGEDVFLRELSSAVSRSALTTTLPQLDCAIEYIRQAEW